MGKREQGIETSRERYQVIPRVLCFITHGQHVLLLKGAPGKRLWANQYNGVGGHVERDEDVYTAAAREIREETGLRVSQLRLRGLVNIDAGERLGILLFVFTARAATRHVTPSSEGALEWVPADRLPASELVEDLAVLLPRVLSMRDGDEPFFAHYTYDSHDQLVIRLATPERP